MKFFWKRSKHKADASSSGPPVDSAHNAEDEQTSASAFVQQPPPVPTRGATFGDNHWNSNVDLQEGTAEEKAGVPRAVHTTQALLEPEVLIDRTSPHHDKDAGPMFTPAQMHPQMVAQSPVKSTLLSSPEDINNNPRDQEADGSSFQGHLELPGDLTGNEPALAGELGWNDVAPVSKWNVDFSRLSGARRALRAASVSTSCESLSRSSSDELSASPSCTIRSGTALPGKTAPPNICSDDEGATLVEQGLVELSPQLEGPAPSSSQVSPASGIGASIHTPWERGEDVLQEDRAANGALREGASSTSSPVPVTREANSCTTSASESFLPFPNGALADRDPTASPLSSGQSFETLLEVVLHHREAHAQRAAVSLVEAARLESVLHAARSYSSAQALSAMAPSQQAIDIMLTLHEQLTSPGHRPGPGDDALQRQSLAGAWVEAALAADLASPPTLLKRGTSLRTPPKNQRSEARGSALRLSIDSISLSTLASPGRARSRQASPRLLGSVTTVAAPPRTPPLSRTTSSKQAGGNEDMGALDRDMAPPKRVVEGLERTANASHTSSENLRYAANGPFKSFDGELEPTWKSSPHRLPELVKSEASCFNSYKSEGHHASTDEGCALQRLVQASIEEEILTLLDRILSLSQTQIKDRGPRRSSSRQAAIDLFALLHRSDRQLAKIECLSPDLIMRQQAAVTRKRIVSSICQNAGSL